MNTFVLLCVRSYLFTRVNKFADGRERNWKFLFTGVIRSLDHLSMRFALSRYREHEKKMVAKFFPN